jgi:hypothetical protein
MFRTRIRTESPSRTGRGSVGSARVWDERTRRHGGHATPAAAASAVQLAGDELTAMVAGIVQVTLDTQLADCDPARRAGIARVLEVRLLSLLGLGIAAPAAPAEVVPEVADEAGDVAHAAPEAPGAPVTPTPADPAAADPANAIVYPPALRALGLVLEDRLERLGGPLAARTDLRRYLVALALGFLPSPGPPPPTNGASGATVDELRNLDLLQRRAQKLEQALRDARAALAYVSGLEHIDQGLSSIYRAVQGLAGDDPLRECKQGALEAIFQANLSLQKKA